jgi:toxin ParE1/3/4
MKLIYHSGALRDLKSIQLYIAENDPAAADRVIARSEQVADLLSTQPHLGRPGRSGARFLSVAGAPYVIIYRIVSDIVRIYAIFHTSRNRRF